MLDVEERTTWTWYKLPRWVFRGRKMTLAEKAVLQSLLDFWTATGCPLDWFHAPLTIITKWAGVSKPTMLNARSGLVKKCLIDFRAAPRKLAARYHLASEYKISTDIIERLIKVKRTDPLKTSTILVGGQESLLARSPQASKESLLGLDV